jgi:hypothetical protein
VFFMFGAILASRPSLTRGRFSCLRATAAMMSLVMSGYAIVGIKNTSDGKYHGDDHRRPRYIP